jgi:flagellar assembly protein FliH
LFSNIIKSADQEQPSIKPYSMRAMPLHVDFSSRASSRPKNRNEELLEEIEERERYIKQVADKTHSLEKEAYEKGFAQGEKAGMELGEKRFDSVIKSFTEGLEEVKKLKEALYQKSEQEMLKLVLAIARRVIQKDASTDEKIILSMIQSALKYVADQEESTVKLNPSDLEFASQHRGEITKGMKKVIFEADGGIPRGAVVIESNRGVIDGGIEKHLQEIEEKLSAQAQEYPQEEGEGLSESREDHVEHT